jgi:hypothetical protein
MSMASTVGQQQFSVHVTKMEGYPDRVEILAAECSLKITAVWNRRKVGIIFWALQALNNDG